MNEPKDNQPIYIDQYDYQLPDDRIAKFPLSRRDASKLLIYKNSNITESTFSNIADFLPADSLLVYNNTRVIQARLVFHKETGARIEVFCLEPLTPSDYALSLSATTQCEWKCMVGNLKKWKEGRLSKSIVVGEKSCVFSAELLHTEDNTHTIHFSWNNDNIHFADILENAGELPIPPYLHRKTEESDLTTYQTVYSKIKGSVAAPTAGLHFTSEVFESLKSKNIETEELTLHVGAGTFQPVKTRDIAEHHMHTEVISVQRSTIENLQKSLGNIVAVGTTSVRTLESLYYIGAQITPSPLIPLLEKKGILTVSQWQPYESASTLSVFDALQNILDYLDQNSLSTLHAETQIMIKPGYKFKLVNAMITNFHQPKSTLLLLVSAFVNGNWKEIYHYAMENKFRFLSYGDSSLLFNDTSVVSK
ncbi:MAG: S-adenosylmethionine:tRNA ribosyltransferase-isomerase [Paludibacter sp.]|nr:S-adenosylmethionine:tRNA ribosyltransferase-isomerase [Paludibacter sp.]